MKKKWPSSLLSLQCLDILLKKFFEKVEELNLLNSTEIFIYGDHLLWGDPWYYEKPRKMLMMMPFRKREVINKPISLFDVAPSILRMLGIDNYSPEFPFGFDFFSQNTTVFPTSNDRNYINNVAHSFVN